MEAWITKYALTKGILYTEEAIQRGIALLVPTNNKMDREYESYYGEGKEWHGTKAEALVRAEEMKQKLINYHKKEIQKLENIRF